MGSPIGQRGLILHRRNSQSIPEKYTLRVDQGASGGSISIGMLGGLYTVEWQSIADPSLTGNAGPFNGNANFVLPIGGQYLIAFDGGAIRPTSLSVNQAQRNKIVEVVSWGPAGFWSDNFSRSFENCVNLTNIAGNWPTNVRIAPRTFRNSGLLALPVEANMESITNATKIFEGCSMLTSANKPFNNVLSARDMFVNCAQLTSLEGLQLNNSTNAARLTRNCTNLQAIPDSLVLLSVTNTINIFQNCPSISTSSYDQFLIRHASVANSLTPGLTINASSTNYSSVGEPARTQLQNAPTNWSFVDAGLA